ncbi:ClpX C4-type zinc finger protein [Yersinia enterocolitica]|uniref:ATP-dependent protease ATP-binding subunit ClpX n=1 Tax=Yersinia enterocolitica TaxID=630 RepID=A0A0T7P7V2_YEREN|nr:ClpX C4-type zinc finger protein [Yersinia enterocolitica]EKN3328623.1 ClpX C4-type zinc finger protein [Yersinia enterocolitica]EKN3412448.1 ClpX C4-type zinc finger protein [Yersinia enterocolitica]EKN3496568.1 ClpX C4-type zinc finger protein [Yersinia enterocolitica]EKN3557444.1 ClpX C4-type zinc finger protein [Yersinia enterocolitica]EKN3692323.1 ClpX C4-type zinc finger protein [Yersinia enterocolitica]
MDISGVNEKGNAKVFCSFCEKPSEELTFLVASKFAAICSDCIALSVKIIAGKANHHAATSSDMTMTADIDEKKPYLLSGKVVLDMWRGVKQQAENQIDFLFADRETKDQKGALSKWVVVVFEDRVCFSRFENGARIEGYAPVPVSKAAVYAAAIVNGLRPPRDLYQCDIPTD